MKLRILVAAVFLLGSTVSLQAQDFDFGIKFGPTMSWIGTNELDGSTFDNGYFGGGARNGLVNGVDDPTADNNMSDRSLTHFRGSAGFFASVRFGNYAVQMELLATGLGGRDKRTITAATIAATEFNNGEAGPVYVQQNGLPNYTNSLAVGDEIVVHYENVYVQIPVLFRYEFLKVAKPFFLLGPSFGIPVLNNVWTERVLVNNTAGSTETDAKGINLGDVGNADALYQPIGYDIAPLDIGLVVAAGLRLPVIEFELRYNLGLNNFATAQNRFDNNKDVGGLRNRSLSLYVGINLTGPR
jgi:Outer membrane protein beta-barrel domain